MALLAVSAHAQAPCATTLPAVQYVVDLDRRFSTSRAYEDELLLRDFALFSYRNIANDIVDGYGPYLDTVSSRFRSACRDQATLTDWLRQILGKADSATDFARYLVVAHDLVQKRDASSRNVSPP